MYVSMCRRSYTSNCIMSLCRWWSTWGSDQSWPGEYNPPISIPQLTQNVKWSKCRCDPSHPSITFIYIIRCGGDILIYHKWKVKGQTCLMSRGWVKNARGGDVSPAVSKCTQVFTVPLGLTDWLDGADKGKVRQMREGRLADKEIRQHRVGWWVWWGLEEDEWTDRQITEHGKHRQMGGEVEREEKCLSWQRSAVSGSSQLAWWIDRKKQTHACTLSVEFIFMMLLHTSCLGIYLCLCVHECVAPCQWYAAGNGC